MTITIRDLRIAREELEQQILEAAAMAVARFQDKTGFTPSSIDIRMADVTGYGMPERHYVVAEVKAGIDI